MSTATVTEHGVVEIVTTVTLGKAEVPVVVTLLGGTLGEPDRHNYVEPVTVGRVMSAGYFAADRRHHEVNGVPIRFEGSIERTQHGLRLAHMTAYRGDKDFGLAEVTSTVRSRLWKALPALVESLLADPLVAFDAEVARAEREVQRAAVVRREANHKAEQAHEAFVAACHRRDDLKGTRPS